MSALAGRLRRGVLGFSGYAYRSLALFFLLMALLRLAMRDGGWINDFLVFLILCSPLVLMLAYRRLRKQPGRA